MLRSQSPTQRSHSSIRHPHPPRSPDRRTRSPKPSKRTHKRSAPSSSPDLETSRSQPARKKAFGWKNGVPPSNSRAKAGDYDSIGYSTIISCAKEFMARVATQDLYPEFDVQLEWCESIFQDQCEKLDGEYECTDRISSLVSRLSIYLLHSNLLNYRSGLDALMLEAYFSLMHVL